MKRLPLVLLCSMLLACSDDGGQSTADTAGILDGAVGVDGPGFPDSATPGADGALPTLDQAAPADGTAPTADASSQLSCKEVSDCSDACAAACGSNLGCLMACPNDCNAKGCPSAQPLFSAVQSCITSQCMLSCMAGPTPACKTCATTKCASQIAACDAQSC